MVQGLGRSVGSGEVAYWKEEQEGAACSWPWKALGSAQTRACVAARLGPPHLGSGACSSRCLCLSCFFRRKAPVAGVRCDASRGTMTVSPQWALAQARWPAASQCKARTGEQVPRAHIIASTAPGGRRDRRLGGPLRGTSGLRARGMHALRARSRCPRRLRMRRHPSIGRGAARTCIRTHPVSAGPAG